MRLSLTARGGASPAEAWDRYARTSRWAQWSPQLRSTSLPEHLATGATGLVRGPLGLRVHAAVEVVDHASRRWSWVVRPVRPPLPGVALRLEHAVGAPGGGAGPGSTTSLVLTGSPVVVLAYAVPARLALARLVRP